jgi:integrase/recombinase XerD
MAGNRGFAAVAWLRERTKKARGGQDQRPLALSRIAPDALVLCAEDWLESLRVRNYAEETITGRLFGLKHFMLWAEAREVTRASEVTRPILEAYQRWLSRPDAAAATPRKEGSGTLPPAGKRLSWSTQRERIGALRDWFRWLTRQNMILHNPASELELPRPERRLPVAGLTRTEVEQLLAVPDTNDLLGLRDRAMLEMLYATGLRRTELCRLECPDVNPERGTVTVRQGKGNKDRVVPLGPRAAAWVTRYVREVRSRLLIDMHTPTLFLTGYGGPFNPDVFSRMVSAWMERAGLAKRGSCHLLRHTCATHMLEGGADIRYIQQQLGHQKLETTAIYTEVTIRQLLEVHARCHPSGQLPSLDKSTPCNP